MNDVINDEVEDVLEDQDDDDVGDGDLKFCEKQNDQQTSNKKGLLIIYFSTIFLP